MMQLRIVLPVAMVLAFLAGLACAQANDEVICETSEGSPYMHHVSELINNLRAADDGNLCFAGQTGKYPGHCGETVKKFSGGGGAAFQMCMTEFASGGEEDPRPKRCKNRLPGQIACWECSGYLHSGTMIASMLERIANECNSPHRAGGRLLIGWPHGGEVRLIRMPG